MLKKRMKVFWITWLSILLLVGCAQSEQVTVGTATPTEPQKESVIKSDAPIATPTSGVQTPQEVKGLLKVHFIDVGQGASQLIVGSSGKTILIDAGNNNMEKPVVDYLKKEK